MNSTPKRDLLDRTFYLRSFAAHEARFPVSSNIYELARAITLYRNPRLRARRRNRLPSSTITFYNRVFEEVAQFIGPFIVRSGLRKSLRDRAAEIYGLRLESNATLSDLLRSDVFYNQSSSKDLTVDEILGRIERHDEVRDTTRHFFLHRAQQSEYPFLNEIIVGHFLNMLTHDIRISRSHLTVDSNYYAISSYVFRYISERFHISEDDLAGLHFADTKTIEAALPASVLESFQMTFQIFLYVSIFGHLYNQTLNKETRLFKKMNFFGIQSQLAILISCFLMPSLEMVFGVGGRRLSPQASRKVDEYLYPLIIEIPNPESPWTAPNRLDLGGRLENLADQIWEEPAVRQSLRRVS